MYLFVCACICTVQMLNHIQERETVTVKVASGHRGNQSIPYWPITPSLRIILKGQSVWLQCHKVHIDNQNYDWWPIMISMTIISPWQGFDLWLWLLDQYWWGGVCTSNDKIPMTLGRGLLSAQSIVWPSVGAPWQLLLPPFTGDGGSSWWRGGRSQKSDNSA